MVLRLRCRAEGRLLLRVWWVGCRRWCRVLAGCLCWWVWMCRLLVRRSCRAVWWPVRCWRLWRLLVWVWSRWPVWCRWLVRRVYLAG